MDGLHYRGVAVNADEDMLRVLVRDGDLSVEVVLVRRDDLGYRTVLGARLGVNGEVAVDRLDDVLAAVTRLPGRFSQAALRELRPLEAWQRHPWLKYARALGARRSSV